MIKVERSEVTVENVIVEFHFHGQLLALQASFKVSAWNVSSFSVNRCGIVSLWYYAKCR